MRISLKDDRLTGQTMGHCDLWPIRQLDCRAGLTKRQQANDLDNRSAQTPRIWARWWNTAQVMDQGCIFTRVCLYMGGGGGSTHYTAEVVSALMTSHGLSVSTERLEMLFWTSRLGLVALTSRSRLGLSIIGLIYNPVMDPLLVAEKHLTIGLHACIILFITEHTHY